MLYALPYLDVAMSVSTALWISRISCGSSSLNSTARDSTCITSSPSSVSVRYICRPCGRRRRFISRFVSSDFSGSSNPATVFAARVIVSRAACKIAWSAGLSFKASLISFAVARRTIETSSCSGLSSSKV